MPIIDHAGVSWAPAMERVRERYLASAAQGSQSLTIKEVEISPTAPARVAASSSDLRTSDVVFP